MSIAPETVEHEYVHNIYSRLAAYQNKDQTTPLNRSSPRIWPRVKQFVNSQLPGSVILDVGCGEAKYTSSKCHVIGFDTCLEVLASKERRVDVALADATAIPLREQSVDAILNVSVVHHLATAQRRRQVLEECCRCLRVGGQMLIYAWAFEQPNGKFAAQDILVPWNMHEMSIGGRMPKIKFHMNTTKEQRIIAASIPVQIEDRSTNLWANSKWLGRFLTQVTSFPDQFPYFYRKTHCSATKPPPIPHSRQDLPSAAPQFLPTTNSIISGIKRWSPMLGRRLASLLVPVEEQFGDEMAHKIMADSITEAMAAIREVTFYRFYHVFKEGELESLVNSIDGLRVISTNFEHGNWCVTAERLPQIRP